NASGRSRRAACVMTDSLANGGSPRGPVELTPARWIGPGSTAGDGGHLDGEPDRPGNETRIPEGRPTESELHPASEERATERVPGTDRIDHGDRRHGDL